MDPMRVTIPYGSHSLSVRIEVPCEVCLPRRNLRFLSNPQQSVTPNRNLGFQPDLRHVLTPPPPPPLEDNDMIAQSLQNPQESESLETFLSPEHSLLVVLNDATRPSLTSLILQHLHPFLKDRPHTEFIIATGTHRPPTPPELDQIFGGLLSHYRDSIHVHDARDPEAHTLIGTTSFGTEVRIDTKVMDADRILVIGNIKPHYFAGFAGGRKSLIPGLCDFQTIEQNHSHALSEVSQSMILQGNPVAEDLDAGVRLLKDKPIFSIQTVMDLNHGPAGVFSGDLHSSFFTGTELAREVYSTPVQGKGNIVITANPFPMDINLYQAQHALENTMNAVEDGGIMILVSKCWNGVGNPAFLDLLDRVDSFSEVEQKISQEGYRLGDHKAYRMMRLLERVKVWMVSDLDPELVRRTKMRPFRDLQKAIDEAIVVTGGRSDNSLSIRLNTKYSIRGGEPRVKVFPQGGMTVAQMEIDHQS